MCTSNISFFCACTGTKYRRTGRLHRNAVGCHALWFDLSIMLHHVPCTWHLASRCRTTLQDKTPTPSDDFRSSINISILVAGFLDDGERVNAERGVSGTLGKLADRGVSGTLESCRPDISNTIFVAFTVQYPHCFWTKPALKFVPRGCDMPCHVVLSVAW